MPLSIYLPRRAPDHCLPHHYPPANIFGGEGEVDSAVSELAIVVPDPRVELNEAVVVQVAVVSTLEDVVVGVGCG